MKNKIGTLLMTLLALGVILVLSVPDDARAHLSFSFKPGNGTGSASCQIIDRCYNADMHEVRVLIGETFEPAFTDGYHDFEMTLTHVLTQLRVGNAHREQTAIAFTRSDFTPLGKSLKVDTYFFPATKLVDSAGQASTRGGVKFSIGNGDGSIADNPGAGTTGLFCDTGTNTSGVLTGKAYNCVVNQGGTYGYADKRSGMFLRPLSTSEDGDGNGGQYRQNTRQYYTEQGLTLYNVYGSLNYFNDTKIGPTKINLWTDGRNVKAISLEGVFGNVNNRTATLSGGFGLLNMTTSVYWPDADGGVTEQTHPSNLRKAIGDVRRDNWDIFNFLRDIASAINSITGGITGSPVNPIPAAKP